MNDKKSAYSSALQCGWMAWRPLGSGELALDLPADNCCDMTGAIRMAETLMPTVARIEVFVDGKLDVIYAHGVKWRALNCRTH
jgi:hypothetical protein